MRGSARSKEEDRLRLKLQLQALTCRRLLLAVTRPRVFGRFALRFPLKLSMFRLFLWFGPVGLLRQPLLSQDAGNPGDQELEASNSKKPSPRKALKYSWPDDLKS